MLYRLCRVREISPGTHTFFRAYTCPVYCWRSVQLLDFSLLCGLIHASQPIRDFYSSGQCFASGFLQTPPHDDALASGCILPTAGLIRDFHPLERAPAGRTKERLAQKPGQPFPSKTKHSERFLKCTGFFIPVRQATHRAGSGSTPPLCRCQPPQACCSSHRGSSPSRRCCRKRAAFCTAR